MKVRGISVSVGLWRGVGHRVPLVGIGIRVVKAFSVRESWAWPKEKEFLSQHSPSAVEHLPDNYQQKVPLLDKRIPRKPTGSGGECHEFSPVLSWLTTARIHACLQHSILQYRLTSRPKPGKKEEGSRTLRLASGTKGCTPALRLTPKGNPDTSLAQFPVDGTCFLLSGNLIAPPMWFRMSIHIARIDYGDFILQGIVREGRRLVSCGDSFWSG